MNERRQANPRQKRSTISDVAARANVSHTAVSKVFNGTGSISAATEDRIRRAARELNWTPSASAVALRSSRSNTIGFVVTRASYRTNRDTSLPSAVMTGMEGVLAPRGYGLLVQVVSDVDEQAETYRRLAGTRRVDGVVLVDSIENDTRFDLLRELNLPAVLVGTPWNDDPIPALGPGPGGNGVREALGHLTELGHTEIAYIGGADDLIDSRDRRLTFETAMREGGLEPTWVSAGEYSGESAIEQVAAALRADRRPTAIVFGDDLMAIAGMTVLRDAGYRIPEHMSVVGYNGIQIGGWIDPPLTTVRRNSAHRGAAAAAMLLRLLGEELTEEHPVPSTHLMVRASTAPPPLPN